MKRYCGMHCGRFGDLYMATVAARALKAVDPEAHLTFTIGCDYREAAPLFLNHPHIDRIRILHSTGAAGHDEMDKAWIAAQGFDLVFDPQADHQHWDPWWKKRPQPLEICHMHGIDPAAAGGAKIEMARWFDPIPFDKTVAFAPFPAWYAGLDPSNNDKALSIERAQEVVDYLIGKGWQVLQVGAAAEPQLRGTTKLTTDYFGSVRRVLGCRAFIGGDTGMMWLMSGYDFPCLGIYAHRYYGAANVRNIQPINPNAIYLDAPTIAEIELDRVRQSLDTLLS